MADLPQAATLVIEMARRIKLMARLTIRLNREIHEGIMRIESFFVFEASASS